MNERNVYIDVYELGGIGCAHDMVDSDEYVVASALADAGKTSLICGCCGGSVISGEREYNFIEHTPDCAYLAAKRNLKKYGSNLTKHSKIL